MKKYIVILFTAAFSMNASGQSAKVDCYPTHWWAGMKWDKLQVMVHAKGIGSKDSIGMMPFEGVKLIKVHKVENPNYVFIDLDINPDTKPGTIVFYEWVTGDKKMKNPFYFDIKERRAGKNILYAQGVNSRDLIYLIMPDRFSNGDESNDRIPGMRDQTLRRDTVFNRHGGDLKGIQNHLDYLFDMGVTSLWLNPVLENDMPDRTEHGYAFTNHYKVDPRLGGDKAYRELIDAAHKKGMKVIQDAVYNHVGLYHHTVQDLPMKSWLNQWNEYTNTSYKDQVLFDPYASRTDHRIMTDGWFTKMMPDLNQRNPFVSNFLIQHALWTVENFGIDGWRIDTYAYNDLDFMNRCNQALADEYPQLTMFGETWVHGVPSQAYFCQNNFDIPFKSNLQAVTDFQTLWGITETMTKDFGWTDGVNKLYTTLAFDFVYKDPTRNVIFLDNHDIARFYSIVGENMDKYLSSITWLLTCRGIPQLYYGAEIVTPGTTSPNDGYVRLDFPGGWKNDPVNKFTMAGRTQKDQEIYQHLATLANYRKGSTALTTGKFKQFVPEDGLYTYFRYSNNQTVMVVMNTSKEEKKVSLKRFTEMTDGFTGYKDVINQVSGQLTDFSVGSYKSVVYELIK